MSRPRQRSAPDPETSRTCKRQAKLLDAKEEQDGLLLSVTVVLVQNGWIGAKEIGRLGVTSRGAKWGDAEIWTALCYRSWPNSADIPQGIVRALGGYRSLYRHRSTSLLPEKPRQSPLPPPRLKPDQFSILIDIFVNKQNVLSDIMHGTELMDSLLEQGAAAYEMATPFVLGCASCWNSRGYWASDAGICTCKKECRFDLQDDYDARIHLLRSTDNASCCVLAPTLHEWDNSMDDSSEELACVSLRSVGRKGLTFRHTATAAEIQSRLLQEPISFGLDLFVGGIVPGDKIGITGFQVTVLLGDGEACGECDRGRDFEEFDEERSKKSGVTVLHLLEQLQGVRFDPTMSLPD